LTKQGINAGVIRLASESNYDDNSLKPLTLVRAVNWPRVYIETNN